MIVAYCLNHAWTKHLPVHLYALCNNNPQVRKVYILSDRIDSEIISQLKPYNYKWIVPPKRFNRNNIKPRFSVASLWRLMLPEFIPDDFCLYLDGDTLVVDNFAEFQDVCPLTVAGVLDANVRPKHIARIKYSGTTYINAGVMWMNLRNIRDTGLHRRWYKRANMTAYSLVDQDVINLTTTPMLIGNEYNSSECCGFHPNPKIIHYAGIKTENWVDGMAQSEHWTLWKQRLETATKGIA